MSGFSMLIGAYPESPDDIGDIFFMFIKNNIVDFDSWIKSMTLSIGSEICN